MSDAAFLTRSPSLLSFDGTSAGASKYAKQIPSQYGEFISRFIESATGSAKVAEPRQAIFDVYHRCRESNWDGDEASAITVMTAVQAEKLLRALPSYLPVPDIFADPTGAISFEWYRRPKHRLVLSIYGDGSIEFAALLGIGNETYGAARLDNGLPGVVRDHLRYLFVD
jgi:hypothetical protein